MKTYSVEFRRTSFVTLTVEAENQKAAEDAAWKELEDEFNCKDAEWELGFVDELSTDDESRSFGPK
jgi:hypothetical protein